MGDLEQLEQAMQVTLGKLWGEIMYEKAPAKMKFPDGLRYRYWGRFELFTGIWVFCYSTTKNGNGKFVSWVYMPNVGKKQWMSSKMLEHGKMKDAKARALSMYYQHLKVQEKYQALLKKRNRKGKGGR